MVEWVVAVELSFNEAGVWVGAVGDEAGKLAVEGNGNVLIAHEDLATEIDWLVGRRIGLLPIELF